MKSEKSEIVVEFGDWLSGSVYIRNYTNESDEKISYKIKKGGEKYE